MTRLWLFLGIVLVAHGEDSAIPLSPVFVTATRTQESVTDVPFSHQTVAGDTLRASANVSVDGLLRSIPGFSLFRRTDSLIANPTAQGVSLRGLGPSGASRTLVLLDGVPLNDPFGGWVLWSKVPREALSSIEVAPGAGGSAWGNAALGGVIQLFTEPPGNSRARLSARTGSFHTSDLEADVSQPIGSAKVQVLARYTTTDGFITVSPERRGPIDTPASSLSRWISGRWQQPLSENISATLTVRRFSERRGNGTPYQQNASDESFASLVLRSNPNGTFHWSATSYAQGQDFSSTFSSVNATRTAETPASNQFAVPSTAIGFAWVGEWSAAEGSRTSFGFDARDVRGETREDSAYVGNAFTRRRYAGGRQSVAGLFVSHSAEIFEKLRASVGLRLDGWQDTDGHRRDRLNGTLSSDERYARRDGVQFSPSAGLSWAPTPGLNLHAAAQHAFRRPTLNELYRPFRVGNVITDANSNLRTETVTSGEVGARLTHGIFTFDVTGFQDELHDAVANVTVARGPGTFPGIGFVPAGGEGRRRLNLDRARVRGVTTSAELELTSEIKARVQYLYDDATVRRASVAPDLVGLQLAQVPRNSASAGIVWNHGRWSIAPQARFVGEQFEDDTNTLGLAAATLVDVSLRLTLGAGVDIYLSAENLADHRLETGRSSDGVVNLGTPRLILLGLRLNR